MTGRHGYDRGRWQRPAPTSASPSSSTAIWRTRAPVAPPSAAARRPTSAASTGSSAPPTPRSSRELDQGGIDVAILDGEAQPTGGMGLARQFKYEIDDCPPIVVLIARPQDGWLASWSLADAVINAPIDPVEAAAVVAEQLRRRRHRHPRRPVSAVPAEPAPSWPALLTALIARRTADAADTAWAMDEIMAGEATPAQLAGVRGAAARQGRDAGRAGRPGADDARPRGAGARSTGAPWTSSAPAPTARTPSTSPRWPRWSSPAPGGGWSSTATGRRTSACGTADVLEELGVAIDLPPAAVAARWPRSASASASRRCSTPGCGTPAARAASSACRPSSTSSAR